MLPSDTRSHLFAAYSPFIADSVLPDTVPELQAALRQAQEENACLLELLRRIDKSDTGIVNWLQANTEIVELKLYPREGEMQCWHFIVHKGQSLREALLTRMERHSHGS